MQISLPTFFHHYTQNKTYSQQFGITSADTSSMETIYLLNTEIPQGEYFHAKIRNPVCTFYAKFCLSAELAYKISWFLQVFCLLKSN